MQDREVHGKRYTEVGSSSYKQIPFGAIPPCQHHLLTNSGTPCPKQGEFDTPTRFGPWADLCVDHVKVHQAPNKNVGFRRMNTANQEVRNNGNPA